MTQMTPPQHLRDLGHAHRHAGMTGVRLLNRVHRECAQHIDGVAALAVILAMIPGSEVRTSNSALIWLSSCCGPQCMSSTRGQLHDLRGVADDAIWPQLLQRLIAVITVVHCHDAAASGLCGGDIRSGIANAAASLRARHTHEHTRLSAGSGWACGPRDDRRRTPTQRNRSNQRTPITAARTCVPCSSRNTACARRRGACAMSSPHRDRCGCVRTHAGHKDSGTAHLPSLATPHLARYHSARAPSSPEHRCPRRSAMESAPPAMADRRG